MWGEVLNLSKFDEYIAYKTNESEEWLECFIEEGLKLEFSAILTKLRESTGLSINEFSKKVGVNKDVIECIENADYAPSMTIIQKIAFKLDKQITLKITEK